MGDIRIIGGEHGSRRIHAPEHIARPTTDRVRESLFSSLVAMMDGFDDLAVLDAYAGSGALALEALSRGAACAYLVESDARVIKTTKTNAKSLGYGPTKAAIVRADSLSAASLRQALRGAPAFDIVFLDPPYALALQDVLRPIETLHGEGALAPGALIVYEHAVSAQGKVDEYLAASHLPWHLVKRKTFGKTAISYLKALTPDEHERDGF